MESITVVEVCLYAFSLLFLTGALDDLIIDLTHFIFRLTPKMISPQVWKEWMLQKEDPIAVMIPAWQEYDVLEAMVRTNLKRIHYENFKWFIGVYPNDERTLSIAMKLQREFSDKVIVVVNDLPGPTTKAQMINKILSTMKGAELAAGEGAWTPRFIAIHDAEDVMHPLSFKAINAQEKDLDFIQVPIFSLPVNYKSWVAGTYMDEFADLHLREIPVRQKLRMPIPSAGVGTFFSKNILDILGRRFGYWLDDSNLTEDYEISMRIARLGGKQKFLLVTDNRGEIISSREYFPNSFPTSVRQKTRWTTGIGLQTMMKWGSYASLVQDFSLRNLMGKYAVWRDRKALWSNPLVYFAWLLIIMLGVLHWNGYMETFKPKYPELLNTVMQMNLIFLSLRLLQRARFTTELYGFIHGVLSFPRLFIGAVINANAALRAIFTFNRAQKKKQTDKMEWDKTQHYFPTEEALGVKNEEETIYYQ